MPNELDGAVPERDFPLDLLTFICNLAGLVEGVEERGQRWKGVRVRVCELLKLCTLPRITKSLVKCRKQSEGEQKLKATTKREEVEKEEDSKERQRRKGGGVGQQQGQHLMLKIWIMSFFY